MNIKPKRKMTVAEREEYRVYREARKHTRSKSTRKSGTKKIRK